MYSRADTHADEDVEPNFFNNAQDLISGEFKPVAPGEFRLLQLGHFVVVDKGLDVLFQLCLTDNRAAEHCKDDTYDDISKSLSSS